MYQCAGISLDERRWLTDVHQEKPRESSESNRNNFASPANGNENGNGNDVEGRSNRGSDSRPPLSAPQNTSHAACMFCSLLTSILPLFIGPWKKRINNIKNNRAEMLYTSNTSLKYGHPWIERTDFNSPCTRPNIWSYKYSYNDTISGYHCVSATGPQSRNDGE